MPQDAYTLQFIARELDAKFRGGKISKIVQPAKDALSLLIYTRNGTVKLDADLSAKYCRVSAGEAGELTSPQNAPNFCMLLRKHLSNAEITGISQPGFERIIRFDLKCFSEFEIADMQLHFEIMGKYSNAILVKDGVILGALKTASLETGAKRVTLSGAKYLPPERQDKADPTNLAELEKAFENAGGDMEKFLYERVAGISYATAADMVKRFGEGLDARRVHAFVTDRNYEPCLCLSNGEPSDFKAYIAEGAKPCKSILEAQAQYYLYAVRQKAFADGRRKLYGALASAVKKCEKRLAGIYSKLEECEKCEDVKLKGELITANIYAVERGASRLEAVNYYDPDCGSIVIDLDPLLTPSQNAQRYFKRYAKLKRTAQNLEGQKSEMEAQLHYLKSIEESISSAEEKRDLEGVYEELVSLSLLPAPPTKKGVKIKQPESVFRTFEADGFTIVCGRNNVQNERLTKGLSAQDMWLHTKSFHSSHVGITSDGREISDKAIKFAAEVCAHYSEAGESGKVSVDYTLKKYVKKPSGAHVGFVVYTDFKTILVSPDAHKEARKDE